VDRVVVDRVLVLTSATARVWALAVGFVIVSVLLQAGLVGVTVPSSAPHLPWWVLALMFYLAERFVAHIEYGRQAHSFSLSEVPLVIGLFVATPFELLAGYLCGAAAALVLHRRQEPIRLAFNLGLFMLMASAAATIFHLVDVHPAGLPTGWAAATAAVLVTSLVAAVAIFVAISTVERTWRWSRLRETAVLACMTGLSNIALGLVAVSALGRDVGEALVLGVPAVMLYAAYGAYTSQRRKRESLEFLYDASTAMHEAADSESAVRALLDRTRTCFQAESAHLALFTGRSPAGGLSYSARGDGGRRETSPLAPGAQELLVDLLAPGKPVLLLAGADDARVRQARRELGVADAMVAPLTGESGLVGMVSVHNRLGQASHFTSSDARLFETLARQASFVLEAGRLERSLAQVTAHKEELRHQAYHDDLTGLPNRVMFADRVAQAEASAPAGRSVAVLFVDLDEFKSVNDRLGHAAGDELLAAVARRIVPCVDAEATVARLGGDEFAVLLTGIDSGDVAIRVARRVLDALRSPFTVSGHTAVVGASIGIAVGSAGGASDGALLRNADIAMYQAKRARTRGYAVYDPAMHAAAVRRAELKESLARAINGHQLELWYQPIVRLDDGTVTGVEALARWRREDGRLLPPSEFIPVAEDSGLIVPLGAHVLDSAVGQLARWADQSLLPPGFRMNVNVSASQVTDPDFVGLVTETLAVHGVPPGSLVLEITESAMMLDAHGGIERLASLRGAGVHVAVDDFGTGYSSLAYLRRFPVDILKLDKSFIENVATDATDATLTRGILQLASALGLSVVAEGIETPEQVRMLRDMGCPSGQGYLFSRPRHASSIAELLLQRGQASVEAPPTNVRSLFAAR